MKIIQDVIPNHLESLEQNILTSGSILLDIETTGLSKKFSSIYLIGIALPQKNNEKIMIRQYFADQSNEEKDLLQAFISDLNNLDVSKVITFNGDRFDFPFIEERCRIYGLDFTFADLESLDLYKTCHRNRKLLGLGSCRQKAIEEFLGIYREDAYNGGELIDVYHNYEKNHDPELLATLLLHNFEDVKDMLPLLVMCRYDLLADTDITEVTITEETDPSIEDGLMYMIKGNLNLSLPKPVRKIQNGFHIIFEDDHVKGALIPQRTTLYHFLPDPKNYYYLPEEDMVIPKVLGESIDRSRKINATKKNCYIKKEDYFLPLPSGAEISDVIKLFQNGYADKNLYISIDSVKEDPAMIAVLLKGLLS